MGQFKQFNLDRNLTNALEELGYVYLTPVQEKVIPLALKGESLLARSETGTGKTHAFLVPIFNRLDVDKNEIQALIIAPTRELAKQIYDFAVEINDKYKNAKILLLTAARDKDRTSQKLANNPHLVITTPGQLQELGFENSVTTLKTVKTIVLDEADMLMDSGFYPLINGFLANIIDTQILIFSATVPKSLHKIIEQHVGKSQFIELSNQYQTNDLVTHHLIDVHHQNRFDIVDAFIKWRNPYLLMIFCSKKEDVDKLYEFLKEKGHNVGILHGDLEKRQRKQMLRRIRNDEFRVIVASDIAARGIDIPDISDILSIDFPTDLAFYFHRAGRTGRYDKKGDAFTFYDSDTLDKVEKLTELGVKFEYLVFKKGEFTRFNPSDTKPKVKNEDEVKLQNKIRGTVSKHRKDKVKPGYKKRLKQEIAQVKREHKREVNRKGNQTKRK